ncbi:MAG: hypothetical protein AB1792_10365, partial [Candidatus Zixiibacteriota bacterium]
AASHDPRPYIRPPSPNLARRTDANHQLLDAKSVRLELKQDISVYVGARNLTGYVQPEKHTDDAAFIYAPVYGRIVYGGMKINI